MTEHLAAPTRAAELASAAAEAADVRRYQTDLDVVALGIERIRTQVDRAMWAGIILGLLFTMANVQALAAVGTAPYSLGWWAAWLLDPMVSLVLLSLLRAEQVTSRYRVAMGPWVRRARRWALAATYAMNTWEAWSTLDWRLIVLHSVPPLLVFAAAEAVTEAREGITAAVAVALGSTTTSQPDPPEVEGPSSGQPVSSPVRPGPAHASPVTDDEVLEHLRQLTGPLPAGNELRRSFVMGSSRAARLLKQAADERAEQTEQPGVLQAVTR